MDKNDQIKYEYNNISKILLKIIKIASLIFLLIILLPLNKYYIWSCIIIIFSSWFMRKKYIDSSTKIERLKCFSKSIKNSKNHEEKKRHLKSANLYEKYESWIKCRIVSNISLIIASIISIIMPKNIQVSSFCIFIAIFTTILEKIYEELGLREVNKFKKNILKFRSFK